MAGMDPADVPDELVRAALKPWCPQCSLTVGHQPMSDHEEDARTILAAALPLYAKRVRTAVAAELEVHAESIGWYEGGGVWAEALDVIRQGGVDD